MSAVQPNGSSICRFLLGLFVVCQLSFLVFGNAVPFLLAGLPEDQQSSALALPLVFAERITDGWVQLTGEGQGWRLFAPEVQKRALFVSVEVDSGKAGTPPRQLPSFFEPDPSGRYWHLPGSDDRLFHLETVLAWPLVAWEPNIEAKDRDNWQTYLHDSIRKRWRLSHLPGLCSGTGEGQLPYSVTLSVHLYPPSVAGQRPDPSSIVSLKLVRWRPGEQPRDSYLPIEVYNEWTGEFQPVTE